MFGALPHVPQPHPLWSGAGRATVARCVPDRPICLSVRAINFADRGSGNSLQYRAFGGVSGLLRPLPRKIP